jgi:acetyl esterase/lipase
MPASGSIEKICSICHADVSRIKRIKDSKGNYYCEPCYAARQQTSKHVDDSGPLELKEPLAPTPKASKPATTPCPGCRKPLPAGTVLCVACGYNLRLGKQATTTTLKKSTDWKAWLALVPLELFLAAGAIALFAAVCAAAPLFTTNSNKVCGYALAIILVIILAMGSRKCRRILVDEYGWSETLFRIPILRNFVFLAGLFSAPRVLLTTLRYGAAAAVFAVAGIFLLAVFVRPDHIQLADGSPVSPPSQLSHSADFVTPPAFSSAAQGTERAQLTCDGPDGPRQLWIYRPIGNHAAHSLPCLFIAPAGTAMIYGATLDEEDSEQYASYAKAEFIVVAYSLDGALQNIDGDMLKDAVRSIKSFKASRGGITNALKAIEYVLHNLPEADPGRLYAYGGGSGGSVALCLAAAEPRIGAVCAIGPVTDAADRPNADSDLAKLQPAIPDIHDFVRQVSPTTHVREMKCPVLLYQPGIDILQTRPSVEAYWKALDKAGVEVRYTLGPSDLASIKKEDGPPGIAWLKTLKSNPKPPPTPTPTPPR